MALYDYSYLGTSTNRIVFNDYTGGTPIYRVKSRAPQQRAIRDLDIPIPFENGISDFETLTGKYAYIINGTMYPGSESESDSGTRALRKVASLEISQDDASSDDGYVPYLWTEATGTKQVFVKVLYVNVEENTQKGLVKDFTFICKIKDPTIFGGTLKTASTQSVDPTTSSGTAEYPIEYPIIYGATLFSVSSDANNAGDLPTYPQSIIVNGPINAPKITNSTTGEYIEIDTNLSTSSNQLVITYDKDSLIAEVDGVSVLDSVSTNTTWFKLEPGSNNITLSGNTIGSGAYVTVSYYDAFPLS